nr:unnamed protein product [Digitaria exilis]
MAAMDHECIRLPVGMVALAMAPAAWPRRQQASNTLLQSFLLPCESATDLPWPIDDRRSTIRLLLPQVTGGRQSMHDCCQLFPCLYGRSVSQMSLSVCHALWGSAAWNLALLLCTSSSMRFVFLLRLQPSLSRVLAWPPGHDDVLPLGLPGIDSQSLASCAPLLFTAIRRVAMFFLWTIDTAMSTHVHSYVPSNIASATFLFLLSLSPRILARRHSLSTSSAPISLLCRCAWPRPGGVCCFACSPRLGSLLSLLQATAPTPQPTPLPPRPFLPSTSMCPPPEPIHGSVNPFRSSAALVVIKASPAGRRGLATRHLS